jgi:LysR family transcriptional regulator, nitrogen assimilation regulatory protein
MTRHDPGAILRRRPADTMIELRTLAYFVTACRCETLGRAAKAHGIALSTLSTSLKALEKEVGAILFRRIKAGLYPTAQARGLLRVAEQLLACEAFTRRWLAAPRRGQPRSLSVDVRLSYAVGGVAMAIQQAIDTMAVERPGVLVETTWIDQKDLSGTAQPAEAWPSIQHGRLVLGFDDGHGHGQQPAVTLLSDRWVFATRLPAGTRNLPNAADLAKGRLVVPALAQPLIEQVDRYLTAHKITGVRFIDEHPAESPRLIDEYPDAALFVPESLISPRLGLLGVRTVAPEWPLTMKIVARAPVPNADTSLFVRHLRRALTAPEPIRTPRPTISMRQIHYVSTVHRLRRISAAAHGANVSQPALSEQLLKLENTLGVRLFKRRSDGMIPTADGDRFASAAKLIESGFRRIAADDARTAASPGRRVTIGILPSVNQHGLLVNRITEAVLDVQARRPALKLVIREAPNSTLQDWVMRGLVGVAIVETGLPHMPRLPLGSSESLAAVAHAAHKLLPPGPVKLAELLRLPLALPTNHFGLRQLLESAAEEHDLKIQPYIEIDALTMVVATLARRPICTVLPQSAVRRELADGELVAHPIIDPVISRRLFVIYSGERALSEPERDLVNTLRSRLADAPGPDAAAAQCAAPQDSRK